MTAKIMYVLYLIESNATGVIMTTMKLKIQLAEVASALAGARIRRGTYGIVSDVLLGKKETKALQSQQDRARSSPASQRQRMY